MQLVKGCYYFTFTCDRMQDGILHLKMFILGILIGIQCYEFTMFCRITLIILPLKIQFDIILLGQIKASTERFWTGWLIDSST